MVFVLIAWNAGHPGIDHRLLGNPFVAHQANGLGRRADKDQLRIQTGLREIVPLRQKAVTRMDRVRAALARRVQNILDVEVGLADRGGADADRDIRQVDMGGIGVRFGEDGDGAKARVLDAADHPDGDFATVGDEYSIEHTLTQSHSGSRFSRKAPMPSLASALLRQA